MVACERSSHTNLGHPCYSSEEHVDTIVEEGAVDALVAHLCAPSLRESEGPIACEHEVEKDAAFALGLLAVKVSELPKLNSSSYSN